MLMNVDVTSDLWHHFLLILYIRVKSIKWLLHKLIMTPHLNFRQLLKLKLWVQDWIRPPGAPGPMRSGAPWGPGPVRSGPREVRGPMRSGALWGPGPREVRGPVRSGAPWGPGPREVRAPVRSGPREVRGPVRSGALLTVLFSLWSHLSSSYWSLEKLSVLESRKQISGPSQIRTKGFDQSANRSDVMSCLSAGRGLGPGGSVSSEETS